MNDIQKLAQQLVSSWPNLTSEQTSLIGSVMTNGAGDGK